MNSKNSLLRNIFFLFTIIIFVFALYACGGAPAPTLSPEEVSGTAIAMAQTAVNETQAAIPTNTAVFPTQSVTDTTPQPPSFEPALLETRRLTLEFPPKIKADSASDIVRLTLEVDDLGNITPTAFYQENIITGEVIQIPNLYETHNVGMEASFDIAGFEVKPAGSIYQPMRQGQPITFSWSIRAAQVGNFRGTIWLYLVFVNRLSGEESRRAVSAQIVEIEAVDFFGFSTNFVRTSGLIGSVLGVIVGFPFFDDIVKYLWSKRKKRKTNRK